MVRVEDVDTHRARAMAAGASVSEAADHMYGERQYTATDLSGRRWVFTESIADLVPEGWGAMSGGNLGREQPAQLSSNATFGYRASPTGPSA